jgi:hypothetical protein
MNFMDEPTRKKLVAEAKSRGAIVIPRMKLQVHQNGAKFPISKVYVDDEQLDPNQDYTLVIIPEGPRLEGVVLTYFDGKIGPSLARIQPPWRPSRSKRHARRGWTWQTVPAFSRLHLGR